MRLLSQDKSYGDQRYDEAGKNSDDQSLRLCVIEQCSAADGFAPDGHQAKEHGFRISNSGSGSDDSAEQRENGRFDQKKPPHLSGSKTKCEQCADFGGALLQLELEEQAHQDQSGQDE